jgi:hypothetical protein
MSGTQGEHCQAGCQEAIGDMRGIRALPVDDAKKNGESQTLWLSPLGAMRLPIILLLGNRVDKRKSIGSAISGGIVPTFGDG